jgi:hypothetical protein
MYPIMDAWHQMGLHGVLVFLHFGLHGILYHLDALALRCVTVSTGIRFFLSCLEFPYRAVLTLNILWIYRL